MITLRATEPNKKGNEMNYIERYWRDATPQDAIKEPPMVARFRDDDGRWIEKNFRLLGWSRLGTRNNDCLWYSDGVGCYKECQVYDAPDPGEGWRLIDPAKEEWQQGDEIYERSTGTWRIRLTRFQDWALSINRRRIEQSKPQPRYEPFRWEDREQLRGRLVTYVDGNRTVELRCELFAVVDVVFSVNHIYADWLCKHAVFVDTKEPVGRRIQ